MKNSRPDGVSLIIAMIFVFAFMFVMAGLFEAQMKTLQNMRNHDMKGKVRFLADSAKELAALAANTNGAGWNKGENDPAITNALDMLWQSGKASGVADCDVNNPCAGFNVVGRSTEQVKLNNAFYYSVPLVTKDADGNAIGTGTAAEKCVKAADANDPCNWNKIKVGQAVDIPLYYTEADGTVDPAKHDFTAPGGASFRLRVRAPCNNYARDCDPADRIVLFPGTDKQGYRDIKIDPVLMQWMVSDAGGGKSVLIARDNLDKQSLREIKDFGEQNTELSAGRINLANTVAQFDPLDNFVVLQYLSSGSKDYKHKGKDMDNKEQWLGDFIKSLSKPILRLNLVTQPEKEDLGRNGPYTHQNDSSYYVPYLEYQILTSSVISDSKSYLTGWAKIGDFRKDFSAVREEAPSLGGFVLGNL